jgi:hypothetical protein
MALKLTTSLLIAAVLAGCATTQPAGSLCTVGPIRPDTGTRERWTDGEKDQLIVLNESGEKICGWKPQCCASCVLALGQITQRFGPRGSEWLMAAIMIGWGAVMLLPARTLDQPAYAWFRAIFGTEEVTGCVLLAMGGARLTAPNRNASRPAVPCSGLAIPGTKDDD